MTYFRVSQSNHPYLLFLLKQAEAFNPLQWRSLTYPVRYIFFLLSYIDPETTARSLLHVILFTANLHTPENFSYNEPSLNCQIREVAKERRPALTCFIYVPRGLIPTEP